MNLEIKDALYYEDLMYEIRSWANIEQPLNEETEERIIEREKAIVEKQETEPFRILNKLSDFQIELFEIVRKISEKAGDPFLVLSDISKYPTLVQEALNELENKKNNAITEDTIEEVCATSNNHNAFIVAPEKSAEFLAQEPNSENSKQMKRVLSKVNIRTDRK